MNWQDPNEFEAGNHGNKPFWIRIPSLVITRGKNDRLNFLTAMWFTPTGAEPSRMVVAIQKKTLTYEYLSERGKFVMSAPTDTMMEVVVFAGYISGHDVDKWQAAKLTAVQASKISVPLIGEAIGNVGYKVVNQMGTKYDNQGKSTGKYYTRLKGVGRADYDSPLLKEYLARPKHRPEKKD